MEVDKEINKIVTLLKNGSVVLHPTDTIWGIGCDVFNEKAIDKIYDIKNRDKSKPFILLVSSIEMLKNYVNIHPRIETLLEFHKRPLSLIFENPQNLPAYCINSDNTVAIRICMNPFTAKIIDQLGNPIVSTSANFSHSSSPSNFFEINDDLIEKVDYTTSFGRNHESQEPSVIAKVDQNGNMEFIR